MPLSTLVKILFSKSKATSKVGELMTRNLFFNSLVFLLLFGAQVEFQFYRGAFTSEFGGASDEATHYVTGLLVRDYLASLKFSAPMKFAEDYYLHYPQIALGHWPPIFYVVQAMWTLPFSPARGSVILLISILTTLLAGMVYIVIRNEFGTLLGIFAGLLLIALPLIQSYSGMVMAEVPAALLIFLAVLCFGRFLDTGKSREATGFGIFAALAILTKANALLLVLVPPLALLFSRRFHLLARISFWWPAVIVLVLCGPWYWLTRNMATNGLLEDTFSLNHTTAAIHYYSWSLVQITGVGLSILVAVGLFAQVIKPFAHQGANGRWAAMGALFVSTWVFHCIAPVDLGERYVTAAVPALLMFLVAGLVWVASQSPLNHLTRHKKEGIWALAVALVFIVETFSIPKKSWSGLAVVAQHLVSAPGLRDSVFLVSSDSTWDNMEGMFISEIAMREKRPGHIVLRASKVLANSSWIGTEYKLVYATPAEIMKYLERVPVGVVVIDNSVLRFDKVQHHLLLKETLLAYPDRWESLGSYPLTKDGVEYSNGLLLYRLRGHETKARAKIQVDMKRMLGRAISGD